ncbi:hypothetical protein FT643_01500 [Ketobacter sp. MCCC 1A13808]|uniref:hypothetical protein n=1 Tax=Ketobacter sp. MCCC 1A13808 TaxID=2602738 RepID=UPI0012EBBD17|nr:hypothetical protein [Ketobacter sp. MCCC 1A13808]MVF10804.1 hypothetical protein [Ketobacter sp. MCCC 1A13808]
MTSVMRVFFVALMITIGGHGFTSESHRVDYLYGVADVEDLVAIPDSPWIIGSGVGNWIFQSGALHLINEDAFAASTLDMQLYTEKVAQAPFSECDGAPDPEKFSAHGLSLVGQDNGSFFLYVVNHGGRHAVEIFNIKLMGAIPDIDWIGCVPSPAMTFPNAVAGRADGSIILSVTFDLKGYMNRLWNEGKLDQTGALFKWTSALGWVEVENASLAQNNGIELSDDEQWAFVVSMPDSSVTRIPLEKNLGQSTRIELDFYPDNIRRTYDGKLAVAGVENTSLMKVNLCVGVDYPYCAIDFRADLIDPESFEVTPLYSGKGDREFGLATTALRTRSSLWFGSVRRRSILRVPMD